jgi:hypothetical protein
MRVIVRHFIYRFLNGFDITRAVRSHRQIRALCRAIGAYRHAEQQ